LWYSAKDNRLWKNFSVIFSLIQVVVNFFLTLKLFWGIIFKKVSDKGWFEEAIGE
jgi:hypothetical protein